jgi:sec-independent protein translocase protein TatC
MITKEIFVENIQALKKHLIYSIIFFIIVFFINFIFVDHFINYFTDPLLDLIKKDKVKLIYTNIVEPFGIRMNLSMIGAIFFSLPFFIWQIYRFISPGLYKKEKKIILPYLFFSPILFFFGSFFVYYFIFPNAWKFFIQFSYADPNSKFTNIEMMIVISDYLNLCIKMMIVFGLAFQMPVIINLLLRFDIITVESLKKARKFVIVIIFIISAILTPPDIFSQIALAIPLIILYESSIWLKKLNS